MTSPTHDPHAAKAASDPQSEPGIDLAEPADPHPGELPNPADADAEGGETDVSTDSEPASGAESSEQSPTPELTDRQLHSAEKFGFSADDLAALGEAAATFAERLVKLDSDLGRRYSKLGQLAKQLQTRPDAETAPAEEPATADASDPAAKGESPESSRPAEASAEGDLAGRVEALQQQLAELAANQREAQRQQNRQTAERFFAALDRELYPQFGEGLTDELADDSDALQQRRRLLAKAGEIRGGYELVHGQKMDPSEALKQALAVVAPEGPVAAERKRIAESVRLARGRQVARPSGHRRGQLADPAQRTAEVLAEWQRSRGVRFFMD